jgi:hypothetical protein
VPIGPRRRLELANALHLEEGLATDLRDRSQLERGCGRLMTITSVNAMKATP